MEEVTAATVEAAATEATAEMAGGSGGWSTGFSGSAGARVSTLALGTLTFGNETSETDSFAQLDRFTSARPAVCSVILGARTLAQLDDNLAAGQLEQRGQSQRDRRIAGGRF
jgi:aryl-alcohol dehydrogenase-like predicted oxidoreductase